MDDQFDRLTEALKAKRLAKMEKEFEKETGLAEMSKARLLCESSTAIVCADYRWKQTRICRCLLEA